MWAWLTLVVCLSRVFGRHDIEQSWLTQETLRLDRFHGWTQRNGVDWEYLYWPFYFESPSLPKEHSLPRRAPLARKLIPDGQVFLSVPLRSCLHNATLFGRVSPQVDSILLQLDAVEGVLFSILYQLATTGEFKPFLDVLPRVFHPSFLWSFAQLEELQDVHLSRASRNEYRLVQDRFLELDKLVKELGLDAVLGQYTTIKHMEWGVGVVSTRCFMLGEHSLLKCVLVPVGDLMDHHEESPSLFKFDGSSHSVIYYTRGGGFEKGTEVMMNYGGEQSNFRFLKDYGFVLHQGSNVETSSHRIRLIEQDCIRPRCDWPKVKTGFTSDSHDLTRLFHSVHAKSVMDLFRSLVSSKGTRAKEELAAKQCVRVLQTRLLNSAKTTIGEDYGLLATPESVDAGSPEPSDVARYRYRLAVLYRIQWKQVLLRNVEFCRRVLGELLPCTTDRFIVARAGISYHKRLAILATELDST